MSAFDIDDVPNWRGRDVIDQNGHPAGVIADIYADELTGRPEWAAVKTGLFSHRVTFVPLSQATLHGLRVQVPYQQSHIHDAPNIHPEGHLSADEEARLFQHYGLDVPATDRVDAEAPTGGRRLRRHGATE